MDRCSGFLARSPPGQSDKRKRHAISCSGGVDV